MAFFPSSSGTTIHDGNFMSFNFQTEQVKRFVLNQTVNVNIEGSGWIVGTVVATGILTAAKILTGSRVRVMYHAPYDSPERIADVPNDPRFIRPLKYHQ